MFLRHQIQKYSKIQKYFKNTKKCLDTNPSQQNASIRIANIFLLIKDKQLSGIQIQKASFKF